MKGNFVLLSLIPMAVSSVGCEGSQKEEKWANLLKLDRSLQVLDSPATLLSIAAATESNVVINGVQKQISPEMFDLRREAFRRLLELQQIQWPDHHPPERGLKGFIDHPYIEVVPEQDSQGILIIATPTLEPDLRSYGDPYYSYETSRFSKDGKLNLRGEKKPY